MMRLILKLSYLNDVGMKNYLEIRAFTKSNVKNCSQKNLCPPKGKQRLIILTVKS